MALSLPSRAACRSSRPGAAPRHPVARCAAAASSSASPDPSDASYDPYAVLGITPLTSPEEVLRAKTRKLQAAATADGAAAVEAAYDAVMLRQLQRRLRGEGFGGVGVSAAVRLGDVDPLAWLPAWRPRVCVSGRPEVLVNLAVAAALVAYTLTQPLPGVLPLTAALVIYFFRVRFAHSAVALGAERLQAEQCSAKGDPARILR